MAATATEADGPVSFIVTFSSRELLEHVANHVYPDDPDCMSRLIRSQMGLLVPKDGELKIEMMPKSS